MMGAQPQEQQQHEQQHDVSTSVSTAESTTQSSISSASPKKKLSCLEAGMCILNCQCRGLVCSWYAHVAAMTAQRALDDLSDGSTVFPTPLPDLPTLSLCDLDIEKVLGEGGFCTVHAAQRLIRHNNNGDGKRSPNKDERTTEMIAIKSLKKRVLVHPSRFECGAADLAIEAQFLNALDHPNIVKLHGVVAGSIEESVQLASLSPACFQNLQQHKKSTLGYFIAVDRLHGGTLHQRIKEWRQEENELKGSTSFMTKHFSRDYKLQQRATLMDHLKVALDVAEAMRYLHSRMIIYRDLKPDNIGFDANGNVKLFDFGLAKECKAMYARPCGRFQLTAYVGTLRYMAPEVAKGLAYNCSIDTYSFGILLWEMCTEKKAFVGYDSCRHMRQVVRGGLRPPMDNHHTAGWPVELSNLVTRCWGRFPDTRPKFDEIISSLNVIMPQSKNGKKIASSGKSSSSKSKYPAHTFLCQTPQYHGDYHRDNNHMGFDRFFGGSRKSRDEINV